MSTPDTTPVVPSSTKAILAQLVSFDSTSANPTDPITGWIADFLAHYAIPVTRSHGPEAGKTNLHAIIGPDCAGGIAFSGHIDCVPVTGQDWSRDPFTLHEEAERLHARGACDMKGFVASMLAAVPDFKAIATHRPIHLFFTFDEEVTCDGARYLAASAMERDRLPSLCVVGEPSMLQPIIAHKGRLAARLTFKGRPAHSSTPDAGVNAVHAMGHAITAIANAAERFRTQGRQVEGFEPPYTTTQVGLAAGGQILNIVPEHATLDVEWRTVPGDDARAELQALMAHLAPIDAAMRAHHPQCGISAAMLCDLPPLALDASHALVDIVQQVTGANTAGFVSYGTEAGIYQNAGVPTIVCGPGDIAQAHKPDEWITQDQLDRCDRFVRMMAHRVCATGN